MLDQSGLAPDIEGEDPIRSSSRILHIRQLAWDSCAYPAVYVDCA
jgi:hypothetical protein